MSALLVVRHDVEDFDTWHKAYVSFAGVQERLGVKHESVHQLVDQPKTVLVLHKFDTVEAAQAFMAAPELQEAMKTAGVVSEPRAEIYESK